MEPVSGEQIAFDVFATSVTGSLSRLAFARTGSRADAEDLVQDVLLDAHRRWEVIGRYEGASREVVGFEASTGVHHVVGPSA